MRVSGKVKKGLRIGTALGYPTANIECGAATLPAKGVYAATVFMRDGIYQGVAVIGTRYEEKRPLVEVHIFGVHGKLYGKTLDIEIHDKISDVEKLESHQLVRKIEGDIRKARAWFLSKSGKSGKASKSGA